MQTIALYQNAIHKSVPEDIFKQQQGVFRDMPLFLQPYDDDVMRRVREAMPTPEDPLLYFASTTEKINRIWYRAEIIGWWDKLKLNLQPEFVEQVKKALAFQPTEVFDQIGRNLLAVRRMEKCDSEASCLICDSTGQPCGDRTGRGGKWRYVRPQPVFGLKAA